MKRNRKKKSNAIRRAVVKVGSNVLTAQAGLNIDAISSISSQICRLLDQGIQIILVSSGAMASGMKKMGFPKRPEVIPKRQAISAIGQGSNLDYLSTELQDKLAIEWGRFTPTEYQHTTLDKVFVGGDFANRTADAISAIEDGHHAARGINRFLNPGIYINAEDENAK